jgi:peptidoglycan/xylan/chitin deacetylase (PgdA/CDA1 family)
MENKKRCLKPYDSQSHAIMFHHFHGEHHSRGQGSISAEQFEKMIDWLEDKYTLLDAEEYSFKLKKRKLRDNDICLTFDDGLLCQADIAAPILKKRSIRAFFFVYTSPFSGKIDYLEIYRYFRMTEFVSIDEFYEEFFKQTLAIFPDKYLTAQSDYDPKYLVEFAIYTVTDKWFRYLRDRVLDGDEYQLVMAYLMRDKNFEVNDIIKKLWLTEGNLMDLSNQGHQIGLHSHSHPTAFHLLGKQRQRAEYLENYTCLRDLLNCPLVSMSHPCGNYTDDTLTILKSMNILIGFRVNRSINHIRSDLEVPREDHSNILRRMYEKNENNHIY